MDQMLELFLTPRKPDVSGASPARTSRERSADRHIGESLATGRLDQAGALVGGQTERLCQGRSGLSARHARATLQHVDVAGAISGERSERGLGEVGLMPEALSASENVMPSASVFIAMRKASPVSVERICE